MVHPPADDPTWCRGLLATLEHHFDVMQSTLGFDWPVGKSLAYHGFSDQRALRAGSPCTGANDACFFADRGVFTTKPLDLHELVHAYLAPLGDSHVVLEEGLAEALSCAGQPQHPAPELALTDAFELSAWAAAQRPERRELYSASAWFVADVFRRHGRGPLLELYGAVRREHPLATVAETFQRVLGEPLDTAWRRALASSVPDGACIRAFECAAPDMTHSLDREWFQRCEQDDHGFTLELDAPKWLAQRARGRGVLLGSCDAHPTPHAFRTNAGLGGNDGESFWLALDAGRYFVRKRHARTGLELELRPLAQSLGPECSALDPLPASFLLTLDLAFDPVELGPSPQWIRVRDLEPARTRAYAIECSGDLEVEVCTGCDPTTCRAGCGEETEAVSGASSEHVVLRVRSPASTGGLVTVRRLR